MDQKLKSNLANSNFIGKEYYNKNADTIVMYFKNNKYIYIEQDQKFVIAQFELMDYTNQDIHNLFKFGVKNFDELNYLLNKFGENQLKMKNKRFIFVFLKKLKKPRSIYIFFVVICWICTDYQFYWCILISHILLILMTSNQKYKNHQKLFNDIKLQDPIDIYVDDLLQVN